MTSFYLFFTLVNVNSPFGEMMMSDDPLVHVSAQITVAEDTTPIGSVFRLGVSGERVFSRFRLLPKKKKSNGQSYKVDPRWINLGRECQESPYNIIRSDFRVKWEFVQEE